MSEQLTLKDAGARAERFFRRALAVLFGAVVFLVAAVFLADLVGDASVGDQWLWVGLAGAAGIAGYYWAQKDNRDARSGRITSVISSTSKDLAVVALTTFGCAAILAFFGITNFSVIVAGVAAGLLAQFVFLRFWVPLNDE